MEEESQEEAKPLGNQIYVMTAAPDHGWTGQGAAYAAGAVLMWGYGVGIWLTGK